MGAKTRLTTEILRAVEDAAPGARSALDLMTGTSVVAWALSDRYRVVANDVQAYATTLARASLCGPKVGPVLTERTLGRRFRENANALLDWLEPAVALEDAFLEAYGFDPEGGERGPFALGPMGVAARERARRRVPRDPQRRARAYRAFALGGPSFLEEGTPRATGPFRGAQDLFAQATIGVRREDPGTFPYLLASSYYPNVYLGLRQAIVVDSLRYAIDGLGGAQAAQRRTQALASLLHATSVTTSATSHFCQPRGLVRDSEVKAVLARRSAAIGARAQGYERELVALRASHERNPGNAAFCCDWRDLYRRWNEVGADVVYADPPYTSDNYSRFYHVLEVLTRYDYPTLEVRRGRTTKGRYPARALRHQSPFCVRRRVEGELRELIAQTAARGAALVLSYGEENGLLFKVWRARGLSAAAARRRFLELARAHYAHAELRKRTLLHSGQGDSNVKVTELLLVARGPRTCA